MGLLAHFSKYPSIRFLFSHEGSYHSLQNIAQLPPLSSLYFFFLYPTAIKNAVCPLLFPYNNSICTYGLLTSCAQFVILPHSISTHSLTLFAYPPALSLYTTSFSTFQPVKKIKLLGLYFDVCHPLSCTLKFYHSSSEFVPVIVFFFCLTLASCTLFSFPTANSSHTSSCL